MPGGNGGRDPAGDECGYNPFHYMETDLEAEEFAKILVANTGHQPSDPKYREGKTALMTALVALIKDHMEKSRRMPVTMLETMVGEGPRIIEAHLDDMFGLIKKDHPDSFAVSQYERFKSEKDKETRSEILLACVVCLQIFGLAKIKRMTGTDSISLDAV